MQEEKNGCETEQEKEGKKKSKEKKTGEFSGWQRKQKGIEEEMKGRKSEKREELEEN